MMLKTVEVKVASTKDVAKFVTLRIDVVSYSTV